MFLFNSIPFLFYGYNIVCHFEYVNGTFLLNCSVYILFVLFPLVGWCLSFAGSPWREVGLACLLCVAEGLEALCLWASLDSEPAGLFLGESPLLWDFFLGLARFFHGGMFHSAQRLRFWDPSGGKGAGILPSSNKV